LIIYSRINEAAFVGNAIGYGLDTKRAAFLRLSAFLESEKNPRANSNQPYFCGVNDKCAGDVPRAQKEKAVRTNGFFLNV
jgi:hypothetical protein